MKPSWFQAGFEEIPVTTQTLIECEVHVGTTSEDDMEEYLPGIEAAWTITGQLKEHAEHVIAETWQHSMLP